LNWRDYHVICFKGFTCNSGDVQGRLAVHDSCTVSDFSCGDAVNTCGSNPTDNYQHYALIAGSLSFNDGSIGPDGSDCNAEYAYCAGVSDVSSYLQSSIEGPCTNCLDSIFSSAQTCYNGLQSQLSSVPDNVVSSVEYSVLNLQCLSNSASRYSVTVSPSLLNEAQVFELDNCNPNAQWVMNIDTNDDVDFHGNNFPSDFPQNVIYNILGSGRTINIETSVQGNILAPQNDINQSTGTIYGKVVCSNANIVQVNKPNCPNPPDDSWTYSNK